jgi:hypothetical protein
METLLKSKSGFVSRTDVRAVACPYCKAPASTKCVRASGERPREANHAERVNLCRERNNIDGELDQLLRKAEARALTEVEKVDLSRLLKSLGRFREAAFGRAS